MKVQQSRRTALIEVMDPLEHRADVTLEPEADLGGAATLVDVAQGQQALARAGVDRLQTEQSQQLRSQRPTGEIDAYHGMLMTRGACGVHFSRVDCAMSATDGELSADATIQTYCGFGSGWGLAA